MDAVKRSYKSKVIWSQHEIDLLVDEVATLRLHDVVPTFLELFNRAQVTVLLENRRRSILAMKLIPQGFVDRVKERITSLISVSEPVVKGEAEAVVNTVGVGAGVKELSTGELARQLFSRLESLLARIPECNSTPPSSSIEITTNLSVSAPYIRPVVDTYEPRRVKKIVFCVIGLLPAQAAELDSRTKDLNVDLRCLNKDINPPIFPERTDEALLFAKFIPHTWQTAAYQHLRRDQVHIHHGGIESGASLLRAIMERKHARV